MKGISKKLLSVVLIMVFALSTVGSVYGSSVTGSNSKLIDRKTDSQYEGYTKVSDVDTQTGAFSLSVKRVDDLFEIYNLTTLTWTTSTKTGAKNVSVAWVTELQTWINEKVNDDESSPFYGKEYYLSPKALGAHEDANSNKKVNDAGDDETSVIDLLRAIREDTTVISDGKTLIQIIAENYTVAYHRGLTGASPNTSSYADGNSTATTGVAAVVPATTTTGEGESAVTTFNSGYTISSCPLGLLFVDAKSNAREYQPVLIDLMPEQVGPTGNWYIQDPTKLNYSLKYEQVGIEKWINNGKSDIVRVGEIVTFKVEIEIPKYMKTSGSSNYEFTMLNAIDDMAQGYTLIPTSAVLKYAKVDASGNNIKVFHPESFLTPDAYGNITVSDATNTFVGNLNTACYVYYDSDTNQDVNIYATVVSKNATTNEETLRYWGEINGELVALGSAVESVAVKTSVLNSYNEKLTAAGLTTISTAAAKLTKRDYTKSTIAIKFNYQTLMSTLKEPKADESMDPDGAAYVPDKVIITYDAIVNENMYVGNNNNINLVTLYYIGDSAGNVYNASSEVVGWTYATNIVKIDGDTLNAVQKEVDGELQFDEDSNPIYEPPTYLDDTHFDLYRLDATYCGGSSATTAPDVSGSLASYTGYTFLTDADGKNYTDSKEAWIGTFTNGITNGDGLIFKVMKSYVTIDAGVAKENWATTIGTYLATINGLIDSYETLNNYTKKYAGIAYDASTKAAFHKYVFPQVSEGSMKYFYIAKQVDSCDKCATQHYHVECYAILWEDITTKANENGVTVAGMDPNTYILIETQAKSGYHKLATGMQFEIKKYNNDQYAAATNSYKGFIDDTNKNIEDGVYKLLVKNYKGIVLPSTGGMGTLIFTIIGIIIMFSAIVFIMVRKKRQSMEF